MIIYDTEVIRNEKKYIYISFFLFSAEIFFLSYVFSASFVLDKITLGEIPFCHDVISLAETLIFTTRARFK